MRVYFRTDATEEIGVGHFIRCFTLAKELSNNGAQCTFLSSALIPEFSNWLEKSEFDLIALGQKTHPSPYESYFRIFESIDAEITIRAIGKEKPDWLVVDHYSLGKKWEQTLRESTRRLMVIDDLADKDHDCDLLLNQNVITGGRKLYEDRVEKACKKLIGTKFAVIDESFRILRSQLARKNGPVESLLVFFGGSDSHSLTQRILEILIFLDIEEITVDIVVTSQNLNCEEIAAICTEHSNIFFHKDVPSLAFLMAKADLFIGAGGTTTWERCCLGLPSIVITVADNQRIIAEELNNLGVIELFSHYDNFEGAKFKQALVDKLNMDDLQSWSERAMALVDGWGAVRVAAALCLSAQTKLNCRLATRDDEDILFEWANDALVRRNSFNPSTIEAEAHNVWFQDRLKSKNKTIIYMVETLRGKLPLGQVRFEFVSGFWEINYSLAEIARGYGLSSKAVSAALEALSQLHPEAYVSASVKPDNIASLKVFEKLKFDMKSGKDHHVFKKDIKEFCYGNNNQ